MRLENTARPVQPPPPAPRHKLPPSVQDEIAYVSLTVARGRATAYSIAEKLLLRRGSGGQPR